MSWKAGSSTVTASDCTIRNSVLSASSPVAKCASKASWARTDSGLLVNAMSWVSASPSRELLRAPMAAMRTSQTPRVRHGCRLLARARDSGLSFMVPSFAAGPLRLHVRRMLTL